MVSKRAAGVRRAGQILTYYRVSKKGSSGNCFGIWKEGLKGCWDAGHGILRFYERLLGLKEPWRVNAVKMDVEVWKGGA
jgi:hypothetical protein